MRTVPQSAGLLWITPNALQMIERAGRTCYKSEEAITEDSANAFAVMLYKRGHHAMLEHASASILFVTDRGVSHEIVRHRIASYAQESTRFCNYSKERFGNEITVVQPPGLEGQALAAWHVATLQAEQAYSDMTAEGVKPQIARSVLPTCLKTEIVMTANLREWLWFFEKRLAPDAHPQMRELAGMAYAILNRECPVLFPDREETT